MSIKNLLQQSQIYNNTKIKTTHPSVYNTTNFDLIEFCTPNSQTMYSVFPCVLNLEHNFRLPKVLDTMSEVHKHYHYAPGSNGDCSELYPKCEAISME